MPRKRRISKARIVVPDVLQAILAGIELSEIPYSAEAYEVVVDAEYDGAYERALFADVSEDERREIRKRIADLSASWDFFRRSRLPVPDRLRKLLDGDDFRASEDERFLFRVEQGDYQLTDDERARLSAIWDEVGRWNREKWPMAERGGASSP